LAGKKSKRVSSARDDEIQSAIRVSFQYSINQSSIPGKSQRILINKKKPFALNSAAQRCFQRGKSSSSASQKGSIFGTSSLSTQSSFSSFAHASGKNKKDNSFSVKQRRFDPKIELKEYFNKEPGPGEYRNNQPFEEQLAGESQSRRGVLNGFVSKSNRFQIAADQLQNDPTI